MIVMYTPRPLPTAPPSFSPYNQMFSSVTELFNRFVTMLQSVPIIPNSQGLFDSQGNWLTPQLSMFDAIVAFFIIGTFAALVLRLSGGSGAITGIVRNSHNEK